MKHKKVIGRLVMVLEVVLLTGMVLLSFYLLIQYMEEGEQSVSGTAVEIETEKSEEAEAEEKKQEKTELVQSIGEDSILIRVRITGDDNETDLFENITVTASEGLTVENGTYNDAYHFESDENKKADREKDTESERDGTGSAATYGKEESYTATAEELQAGEALRLIPDNSGTITVTSLMRADGSPAYGGELYIYRLEDGLALVNELELEEYLYAVVSSEMPSYFPIEALKAQAVCARTYAVGCINENKNSKLIADLDDSVRFQVYNNRMPTDTTREAVDTTSQMILTLDVVQYYSTSCLSEHREDLDEEQAFRNFLSESPDERAEYGSAWVRWETAISVPEILECLADVYGIWAETLDGISVESRGGNGQAQLLRVVAGGEIVEIEGEYAIRQFLSPTEAGVELMDGTTASGLLLLPSAFFWLEIETGSTDGNNATDEGFTGRECVSGDEGENAVDENLVESESPADDVEEKEEILHIYGGGYGHGNGMSQYGAAQMATEGASYLEILEYYYSESG
ncbi:MAG: SpoIID/LytB domain-containing protein [Clostridiales bacterium]|nr:SpoIID/LytB domain-containing protein [Clostridiales bacterium]